MVRRLFAIAVVLLLFGAGTGYSQIVEKTSDLTGFVGIVSFEGADVEFNGFQVESDRSTEFTVGARYAYHINAMSTIEGTFGIGFPEGGKFYNYFVNYRYNIALENEKLVPFVTGGVGALTVSPDSDQVDSSTDMSVNVGGGLLFFAAERIGVRVDVRDLVVFAEDNTTNNIEITGGISYFFM